MKASLIVCTYNRAQYIYNLLKSIADTKQPYGTYEIVLVNNNSTDTTQSECERFCADYPNVNFNYCVETQQGLSYARNRGIVEAKGDLFIYVDDDALVDGDYIQAYIDFFMAHPHAMGAGGPVIPHYETAEPKWMSHFTLNLITGYHNLGKNIVPYKAGSYPIGCNSAFRKEVFEAIGHFNVELGRKGNSLMGAEEKDIFDKMRAAGMSYYYLPTARLFHLISEAKLTQDYFTRLTKGIGQSERLRTKAISNEKYLKRLVMEGVKWGATLVLWFGYTLTCQLAKANKLVAFRANVTKGLLG